NSSLAGGQDARCQCHVELVTKFLRVKTVDRTNDYNLRAWSPFAPFVLQGNVHAPANHLQHGPLFWRVGGINYALGPINCSRQLAHGLPQRFQLQRLVGFIVPCAKHFRVVVSVVMVMAIRVGAFMLTGMRLISSWIEPSDAQQDFVWHLAMIRLDDA